MDDSRALVILVFVVVYLAMCVGVGVWALRRTTSARDFFMAGRDLGILVTGLAVFSSTMSGFGFVGGPGLVYRMGLSSAWMTVISPLGFCCVFYLLGTRLRMVAELRDTISLPDAVAARYRSERTRLLTAVAILLGVVGYLGTQILAMATVLRDVLNNVSFIPEVSLVTCMAIACAVLVFYCVTGGILASVYTDLVQGAVMIVAAVCVFFAALSVVDGGLTGIVTTIIEDDPEAITRPAAPRRKSSAAHVARRHWQRETTPSSRLGQPGTTITSATASGREGSGGRAQPSRRRSERASRIGAVIGGDIIGATTVCRVSSDKLGQVRRTCKR